MTEQVSYKGLTPNTGGIEAQEGFSYQHHVAVSHFIDMLNRRDLIRINLEQIDDITLIWQDGDEEVVELVQVKKGDKIWYMSDIASKSENLLVEKQIKVSDETKEKVTFKVVTVRDVHESLEILKEEKGEERSKSKKSVELIRMLKNILPDYGEKIDNWVNNCYWRNAGGENAVINDNRTKLEKFLDEEGYAIGSTKCTSFVKERLYEYVARKSKEKPPTLTFIERESFKEWFDKEIRSYITELTIFKDLRYSNTKSVKETRRLFDVGIFYENIEYIVKIIDNLAKYGRSLITGKPGSGKSAIACYIGLKLLKEGTFNRVFYLYGRDSVTDKVDDIFNEIKNHDRKDVLFIIDDCHLMAGKVNNLLYRWEQVSEAKLLLISRDIAPDLVDPDSDTENYFKVLEEYIVKIKYTSDSIKEIIGKRLASEEEIGDINVIVNRCEGDIHILNFYIAVFEYDKSKTTKQFKCLSDINEDTVLEDIYKRYLSEASANGRDVLLKIAALSQFEIPVVSGWIGRDPDLIEGIKKNAWIEDIDYNNNHHYIQYFHSTPAKYLLRAAEKERTLESKDSRFLDINSYTYECVWDYLQIASNYFNVFKKLGINKEDNLILKLVSTDGMLDLFKKNVNIDIIYDISMLRVVFFLKGLKKANVDNMEINKFCEALDFNALTEKAALPQIETFLNFLLTFGINETVVDRFCYSLNFTALGYNLFNSQTELKKNVFYIFRTFLKLNNLSDGNAIAFIEGIGWDNLKLEVEKHRNADTLAVIKLFLKEKCQLTTKYIKEKGINFDNYDIWFNAFTNHTFSRPNKNSGIDNEHMFKKYRNDAVKQLSSNPYLLKKRLCSTDVTLKSLNLLIDNLRIAKNEHLTVNNIAQELRGFDKQRLASLFSTSDIQNVGIFLSHFNKEKKVIEWDFDIDIDYQKIIDLDKYLQVNADNKNSKDKLLELAHFMFSFYYINRPDLCNYYARELDKNADHIIKLADEATLRAIDFFLWNLWMSLPEGEKPAMYSNQEIWALVKEKVFSRETDKDSILSLIGTMRLADLEIPSEFTVLLKPDEAKDICSNARKKSDTKKISARFLAGLSVVLKSITTEERAEFISALYEETSVPVPNRAYCIDKTKDLLNSCPTNIEEVKMGSRGLAPLQGGSEGGAEPPPFSLLVND